MGIDAECRTNRSQSRFHFHHALVIVGNTVLDGHQGVTPADTPAGIAYRRSKLDLRTPH